MQAREALKHIIKSNKVSYTKLGESMGMVRQNAWDFINAKQRKDITANRFVQIANLLGYKVTLVPSDEHSATIEVGEGGNHEHL